MASNNVFLIWGGEGWVAGHLKTLLESQGQPHFGHWNWLWSLQLHRKGSPHHDSSHAESRSCHCGAGESQAYTRPERCWFNWTTECRLVRGSQGGDYPKQCYRYPQLDRLLLWEGHSHHRLRYWMYLCLQWRTPNWWPRISRDWQGQLRWLILLRNQGTRRGGQLYIKKVLRKFYES